MFRLGGPILASAVQAGALAGARGETWRGVAQATGQEIKRGVKRKALPIAALVAKRKCDIDGQERVSEHGGTPTRRAGGVMWRGPRVVVQSRPTQQRSIPSPFRSQRGGWISGSVPKPPGYDLTKWLLARRRRGRTQRGGWIDASMPKQPGYGLTQYLKRRRRAQRGGWISRGVPKSPWYDLTKWGVATMLIKRRRRLR